MRKKRAVAAAEMLPAVYVSPMKPVPVGKLPLDAALWLYEIKFDGYRVIALKNAGAVELWSGSQKPLNFPALAQAVAELPCHNATLDGEIVALDAAGRPSFQLLQNAAGGVAADTTICLYLFDLLHIDGEDLRSLDTVERKARLTRLLDRAPADDRLRLSANLDGDPVAILAAAGQLGLEGVVAKSRTARYLAGVRGPLWQKVKIVAEQDFVIGGYTAPEGGRKYFGALLVGYYAGEKLQFAARVGSGFSDALLERLHRSFQPMRRAGCPFVNLPVRQAGRWGQGITPAKMRLCTWIEPTLVCRVRFAEWTEDGGLRHPVFLGLRDDKTASEVQREPPPA